MLDFLRQEMVRGCDTSTCMMGRKTDDSIRVFATYRGQPSRPPGPGRNSQPLQRPRSRALLSKDPSSSPSRRASDARSKSSASSPPRHASPAASGLWHSDRSPQAKNDFRMVSDFEQRVAATKTMECQMALQRRKMSAFDTARVEIDVQNKVGHRGCSTLGHHPGHERP